MDLSDVRRLIFIVSSVCLNEDQFVGSGVREVYFFIEIEFEFIVRITDKLSEERIFKFSI